MERTAESPVNGSTVPTQSRAESSTSDTRSLGQWTILAGAVIVAILLRVWVTIHLYVISNDAAGGYLYQAREILRGNWKEGLGTYFPPGYPLLVSGFSLILGDVETAGRFLSILCGGLLVIVLFGMTHEFYGRRAALVAAVFAATYPVLVEHSVDAVTEGLYTLLMMLATWAGWKLVSHPTIGIGSLVGGLFGLAYLVRGEALIFVVLLMACMGVSFLWHGVGRQWTDFVWKCCAPLMALLCGFAVLAVPYMIFLRSQFGTWSLSGKTVENLIAYDITERDEPVDLERIRMALTPDGKRLQTDFARKESAIQFLWENRDRQLRKYALNLARTYLEVLPRAVYPIFLLLMGAGLFYSYKRSVEGGREIYLAAVFMLPLFFYPLFLVEVRYMAPVVPIALSWAARGAVQLSDLLTAASRTRSVLKGLVLIVLVGGIITVHSWPIARMLRADPWSYPLEHKAMGEWLRIHGKPHAKIMNRKSYVAFYAQGEPYVTPYADYDQLLNFAREHGIDYLVVDERYTIPVRPAMTGLADGRHVPPELELLHADTDVPGRRIVVYGIRPNG